MRVSSWPLLLWVLLLAAPAALAGAPVSESRWSAAWLGEPGLNPGVKLALERRHTGTWRPHLEGYVLAGPALGAALNPQSHLRTLLSAEAGGGITLYGIDLELRLSGGGGYAWLASPTYRLSPDGQSLQRVPLAGQWAWMPAASLGLGSALRDPRRRWFARGGLMLQIPYHDDLAPFALLELGVSGRWSP